MVKLGGTASNSHMQVFQGLEKLFRKRGIDLDWVLYSGYDRSSQPEGYGNHGRGRLLTETRHTHILVQPGLFPLLFYVSEGFGSKIGFRDRVSFPFSDL